MDPQFVTDILVRRGVIDVAQGTEIASLAREKKASVLQVLSNTPTIEAVAVVKALAAEVGIPSTDRIDPEQVDPLLIEQLPITFARQHKVIPLRDHGSSISVAVADPLATTPLDDLRILLRKPVDAIAAPLDVVEDAINRIYERRDETALAESSGHDEVEELQDLVDMTDEAPVIRWVNNLFYNAVKSRASDIHIEPAEKEVVVRYRIDGSLYPVKTAHRGFLPSIVSRVKIEAGLNIAEKRLPQDGRITKKIQGKLIDIRVSTVPTSKGERVVMRLLDKESITLDLKDLGFAPDHFQQLEDLINRPNGIVLVTGPTGAGKTTTLYGCLNRINTPDLNILTVEDPVEYELPGIGQMQIHPKIGLTFASGLRSFLRQDPDVIMVGEIRDKETAEIAIHASLTGHFVLSTLHTNDAPSAITRLVEMEIQPFLISSSLLGVLAQRLVRRLCINCKTPYEPTSEELLSLGLDPQAWRTRHSPTIPPPRMRQKHESEAATGGRLAVGDTLANVLIADRSSVCYRPVGCPECSGTGYRGRQGIFELLIVDDAVRKDILNSSDSNTIFRTASLRGMRSLRQDGARQVLMGNTSIEEVLAATQAGELE